MVKPPRVGLQRRRANHEPGIVVVTLLATLVAVFVTAVYLDAQRSQRKAETLNQLLATHDVAWRAVQNQYATTVRTYYEEFLSSPELMDRLVDASNPADRTAARVGLYRVFYPQYRTLAARGVQTLQIILPDGEVLLRFHRPDRYGDRVAIPDPAPDGEGPPDSSKPDGAGNHFRVGGTVSGFRYLVPVETDRSGEEADPAGDHSPLGYVELGIPFENVRREMARLIPGHDFQLILRREVVREVVFIDQQRLYGPWSGSDAFVIEDPHGILPGSAPPLSRQSDAVVTAVATDAAVQNALRSESSSAVPVVLPDQSYALVLIAVHDRMNRNVGFVASYAPEAILDTADTMYRIGLAVATLVLTLFAVTAQWLARNVAHRLRERRRLRQIHDTLGEGLYVMDREGRITDLNARAGDLLGYQRSELLGTVAHTVFHRHQENDHTPLAECPIFRTTMAGNEFHGEEIFRRADGALLPVDVTSRPIIEKGEIAGAVTSFRDLSDRKRTLARLRTLSMAVEQSPESIVITDRDGKIEYVNAAFVNKTGYAKEEARGRNPRFLSSGKTERTVFGNMWRLLHAGKSWHGELINRRKDATEYVEEAILSPIINENGETVGFLGIKQDITGRKQDEEELRRRLAEKEVLLREVHHRVRNNLNIIVSLLNLQSTDISSPEAAVAAFEKTRDRVISISLVHDVLNRSTDLSQLDAEEYVSELTAYLRQVYNVGSGISVDYTVCSTSLTRELAVPCGLILTELVSNAFCHAFPDGRTGTVTIRLEPTTTPPAVQTGGPRTIRLSVADSGIGSWTPFDESGALGLMLVRMLAEQISGTLTIGTSRGTLVTIEFPG